LLASAAAAAKKIKLKMIEILHFVTAFKKVLKESIRERYSYDAST